MIFTSTIAAPATPHGPGGISVIRISGTEALDIARNVTGVENFIPRQATFCSLYEAGGNLIDRGLVTFFNAPHSYTGEDVVEVSCHGSPVVVQRLVSRCFALGAEPAQPGEFTRRAFINGKLDLLQAESVGSLIQAQSQESADLNLKILKGDLSEKLISISSAIVEALGRVEFELDISEEVLQPSLQDQLNTALIDIISRLKALLKTYTRGRLLTDGALVVILGRPNVGKSTLLNALAGYERVITSADPGTTRDAIEISLLINGVRVTLVDTAGLRETESEIERAGIQRSQYYADKADLILHIYDSIDDKHHNQPEQYSNIPNLSIYNKIDLLTDGLLNNTLGWDNEAIYISAKTGSGMDALRDRIKGALGLSAALSSDVALTTARQADSVNLALAAAERAQSLVAAAPVAFELVSVELREALDALDRILGKTTPDDILNSIFNSFCVGK